MNLHIKRIVIHLAWVIIFLGTEFLFHSVLLVFQSSQKNAFIYNSLSNYNVFSAIFMVIFFMYPIMSIIVVEKFILNHQTSVSEKIVEDALISVACLIIFLLERSNNIVFSLCGDYLTAHGDFTICGLMCVMLLIRHVIFGIIMILKLIFDFFEMVRKYIRQGAGSNLLKK